MGGTEEVIRKCLELRGKFGADDPIRTDDLLITSELLYQLSYVGPGGDHRLSIDPSIKPAFASQERRCPPMGGPRSECHPFAGLESDGADDLRDRRGAECSAGTSRRHRS